MHHVLQGVRHAARRLARSPSYSAAAVLTLMLGIGATTAVFSIVNGVLLKPLPYADSSRLVDLSHTLALAGITHVDQSDATYLYYRRANRTFTDVGAYQPAAVTLGRADGGGDTPAERATAARISANLFGILRVAPLQGRAFRETEDKPGAAPVVIIGQSLWERKYARDAALVGRRIEIDGVPREVVGIMPASFQFPAQGTEVWVPVVIDAAATKSAIFDYRGIARLKDGVTPEAAAADLQPLLRRVPEVYAGRLTVAAVDQIKMRTVVQPMRDVIVGDVGHVLWVLLGSVAFVLLIACANVANLLLVRAEGRRQELAVRRALGAGRTAIMSEFLYEGVVLAALGGALGVILAFVGVRVLRSLSAGVNVPRLHEIGIDATVFGVACAATLLAALLVSLLPALRSSAANVSQLLTQGGRGSTAARAQNRAKHALIVAQVALALVLLTGAGLMARSFAQLRAVKPGFDATGAFTFRIALADAVYSKPGDAASFLNRALDALAALPGVTVGAVTKLPLDAEARRDSAVFFEDRPFVAGSMPTVHQISYASPEYFSALRIPFVEGRTFERPDPARARLEVIVTRAFAERYFKPGRAVGRRLRLMPEGPWSTIVGVTGNIRGTALEQPPDETVYLPLVSVGVSEIDPAVAGRWTPHELAFVMRGAGDPTDFAARAERALRALDPTIPVYAARPMTDIVARAGARTYFTLLLLGIASAIALVLGAVGIYGVISYVVSLRTREIAVRLALGAQQADVRRMVSRQALGLAALGIVIGLVGAIALTRFIAKLLFGVRPIDPLTLGGAAALLLAVALVASWLPASRAAGVDPARALRAE